MGLWTRVKSLFTSDRVDFRDRFELMREAVHGTMSQFYQARDRQTGQIVGLKILDAEQHAAFEARFEGLNKPSEGRIARQLFHPGIVRTDECGITTNGEPYLVMEYLDGQGLNTLISTQDERLTRILRAKRSSILIQAAEALAAVHEAGFIHRDVCPRNFVVSPRMDAVKLIDFGLTVPDLPEFRAPGNRTGTPRYMAPEIVRRRATDQRVDIFSFGVTAFELFAGESPWSGVVTGGDVAMREGRPAANLLDLCADADPAMAAAIQRCLEPDPADRPQTMREFLADIASPGLQTA